MFVGAVLNRGAAFVCAPGPLAESPLTLIQVLLASIRAGLSLVGQLLTTVGYVLAVVSDAIALVGDVDTVGRFWLHPGAVSPCSIAARGSRRPGLTHPSTVAPVLVQVDAQTKRTKLTAPAIRQ